MVSPIDLRSLSILLVAAPMAGGPSTPELVAAVGNAGGLGMLAAGYKAHGALGDEIADVRARSTAPFGVNVFVPDVANVAQGAPGTRASDADIGRYRDRLARDAARLGVTLPEPDPADTDDWAAKIDLLIGDPVPTVSFTFGIPDRAIIERLQAAGTSVVLTVTSVDEAVDALGFDPDALCIQGPLAGGHRGTHRVDAPLDDTPLETLVSHIREMTSIPLIAAGGLVDAASIGAAFRAGADVAQLGSVFLLAPEAGTSPAYRTALEQGASRATRLTRAFSGRLARGLVNQFMEAHHDHAPAAYPEVNQLTRPLRAVAALAGDAESLSLWVGSRHENMPRTPAAETLQSLWSAVQAASDLS